MWKRLVSGIVLIALLIAFIVPGGKLLWAGTLIISLIGLFELYRVEQIHNKLLGFVGYLGTICYYGMLFMYGNTAGSNIHIIFFVGVLIVMMSVYVFTFPTYKTEQVMGAFFGQIYVSVMLSYIYMTRIQTGGAFLVWLIFLSAWGNDTCAYCVGMLIGKHKMSPKLSPKKSIEGAIGGVVGAAALGAIFGSIFERYLSAALPVPALDCAIICLVGALISIVGDLAASAIKRDHGVKDYSNLIPGHGGILDRFDSVIFVAPAIYITIYLLNNGVANLIK